MTIIFSITSCILTIVLPSISTVLSILGGIGCVTLCFVVPMIAYLTVLPERRVTAYVSLTICSLLVALGFGSCCNAIFRAIDAK